MATTISPASSHQPVKPAAAHHHRPPPATTPPKPQPNAFKPQQQQQPPTFINSVTSLRHLSTALAAFHRHYDELQQHLDFIQTSLDSHSPQPDTDPSPPPPLPQQSPIIVPVTETLNSQTPTSSAAAITPSEPANPEQKELEFLCKTMKGTELRKFIGSRLTDLPKVKKQVTEALKLAPNPPKLTLECFGRFFIQSIKAFTKELPLRARRASFLVLECFLLMGSHAAEVEPAVKEEAKSAALAWRARIINEGGLEKVDRSDARGLILFLACFGIPAKFSYRDVRDLIRSGNVREISDTLRRSDVLKERITEIIEWLVKNQNEVEAVDIAYTFGLENRFPPQAILSPFLLWYQEASRKNKNAAQSSIPGQIETNKMKLADLKSLLKCLKDHKIDPLKILPGFEIKEHICRLEKEIADLQKTVAEKVTADSQKKVAEKVTPKRKADEIESVNMQERKPLLFEAYGPQRRMTAGHADIQTSYNGLASTSLSDGRLSYHINNYSVSPSALHGYGAGPSSLNIIGSVAGSGGSVVAPGVGQVMNQDRLYGWHGDAAFHTGGVGHSLVGQPATIGVNGLYRPSSLEGFPGCPDLPSTGVSNRSSSSDLYNFADAVVEGESYNRSGSGVGGGAPSGMPAHRRSYLY